jgi:hypothetical protein
LFGFVSAENWLKSALTLAFAHRPKGPLCAI